MDQIRRILAGIAQQLGKLSVSSKLLIAALCVVVVMMLVLVSQYSSTQKVVELLPSGTGEDQQKAAAFLSEHGIDYTVKTDGKVVLSPERKYMALAQMAKAQQLPGDKTLLFKDLATSASWIEPLADKQQKATLALQNELAMVIRNFPGINDASVFISNPDRPGLGAAMKKPVAQLTVFPGKGQGLDQGTVNALADLVAGSVSGLDIRDVAVVDGQNRRSYRAAAGEDAMAGTYMEQVAKVEKRVQEKVGEHLRFIQDVIVSVNAIVDGAKRESVTTKVLPKGDGTVAIPVEETSSNQTSSNTSKSPGEPGVGANIQMDISRANGGSTGTSTNDESSTIKTEVRFGQQTTTQRDASGKPTKINVTVSVPREYVAAIVKQRKGLGGAAGAAGGAGGANAAPTEPTDAEIAAEWENQAGVKSKIEEMIAPLVETEGLGGPGATQLVAGTVKAFLIPVALSGMAGVGGGQAGVAGTGGGGMLTSVSGIVESSLVKTAMLGLLAVISLGLMVTLVRKASKTQALPTAEELVGIPPALQPGSDVVGEADEGDTAMQGIEIDEGALKVGKMLEEIGELVNNNPQNAASVFNRWLATDE